jgi:protein TonB
MPDTSGARATGARGGAAASDARAALLSRYVERVRARVEQHREYPYVARRANLEGTICLRISIGASGSVLGITATCGTSHEPLLQAALASVSQAAPFPPLPAALGGRLTLDVPVVFQLDSL